MPTSPIVFNAPSSEGFMAPLANIGAAAGLIYSQRQEAKRNVAEGTTLSRIIEEHAKDQNASTGDLLSRILGSGVRPEAAYNAYSAYGKGREDDLRAQQIKQKLQEVDPSVIAEKKSLDILARQRELQKTGHLGPKIGIGGTGRKAGSTFTEEGRKIRAEYEQLGKALVQAAAPLKITNRNEFNLYAEKLHDPNLNNEQIEGILNALEKIIRTSTPETSIPQENPKTSERQQSEVLSEVPKKPLNQMTLQEIFG